MIESYKNSIIVHYSLERMLSFGVLFKLISLQIVLTAEQRRPDSVVHLTS